LDVPSSVDLTGAHDLSNSTSFVRRVNGHVTTMHDGFDTDGSQIVAFEFRNELRTRHRRKWSKGIAVFA
jgi:hypothetical protein